jgi:hypothetical protein
LIGGLAVPDQGLFVVLSFPLFFVCQRECVMLPAFPAAVD